MNKKIKSYAIKISYHTGDSYSSHDEDKNIELEWDNLEIAKENLKRIKDHFYWYEEIKDTKFKSNKDENIDEPVWHKKTKRMETIFLKTDEGQEMEYNPFWFGYFERIQSAEIVFSGKMRVDF